MGVGPEIHHRTNQDEMRLVSLIQVSSRFGLKFNILLTLELSFLFKFFSFKPHPWTKKRNGGEAQNLCLMSQIVVESYSLVGQGPKCKI